MKLEKSFNSKLYRWFYCTNELPKGFCPYFWKLAIAWLFLIPVGLIGLPMIINYYKDLRKSNYSEIRFSERLGNSLGVYCGIYLVFCLVLPFTLFFTTYEKDTFLWSSTFIGFIVLIGFIIVGIAYLIEQIKENRQRTKYSNDEEGRLIIIEKKPNLIIEFIKAKYNKHCPKIEWVDKEKK